MKKIKKLLKHAEKPNYFKNQWNILKQKHKDRRANAIVYENDQLKVKIIELKRTIKQQKKQIDNINNNNTKNVINEYRSQVNKLNQEIKNGTQNSSYSLSLLIEINKIEQDAKVQQQKFEVYCI